MKRDFNIEPRMQSKPKPKTYCEVPIVARSPSYQQPVEEAIEQTNFALKQRKDNRERKL